MLWSRAGLVSLGGEARIVTVPILSLPIEWAPRGFSIRPQRAQHFELSGPVDAVGNDLLVSLRIPEVEAAARIKVVALNDRNDIVAKLDACGFGQRGLPGAASPIEPNEQRLGTVREFLTQPADKSVAAHPSTVADVALAEAAQMGGEAL